jgi:hypothetical protein
MTALRNLRAAVLLGSLSMLALSAIAAPAVAAYPYNNLHDCRDRVVFGNTSHFYPTTLSYSGYCRTNTFARSYNVCPQRFSTPVVLYDSFGRPYAVYQTNYSALLR